MRRVQFWREKKFTRTATLASETLVILLLLQLGVGRTWPACFSPSTCAHHLLLPTKSLYFLSSGGLWVLRGFVGLIA